jgi:hypothetical protein
VRRRRRPRHVVDEPGARRGVAIVAQDPPGDRLALETLHDHPPAVLHPQQRRHRDAVPRRRGQRLGLPGLGGRVLDAGRVAAQHQRMALGAHERVERPQLPRGPAEQWSGPVDLDRPPVVLLGGEPQDRT